MSAGVVAIDVGGTNLKGAAFGRDGTVMARHALPTFAVNGRAADGVRTLLRHLIADLESRGLRTAGVGIACPGMVDSGPGVVKSALNLSWTDLHLQSLLQEEFGLRVVVDHDARAGALAERAAHPGGSPSFRDFVFIPIGTGVAAAIVTGGQFVTGASAAAGEFGHVPVVPGGQPCVCGQRGCVEAYASGSSILRRYLALGGTLRSTAQIAAGTGTDQLARTVWTEAIDALATGIIGLIAAVDPATVVLGGGVAQAGAALFDPLGSRLAARLTWRPVPALSPSVLGPRAGLIGAGLLGWDRAEVSAAFCARALAGLTEARPA